MSADKQIRERLDGCLDKLGKIRPTDLIREDTLGPQLNFRAGIPFFERTLTLYRQVAATNLSRVPSPILEIAANHAEQSLNQFEQIASFAPSGIDRPEQVRNLLINEVREAHAPIYEDLCILLAPNREQMEKVSAGPRPLLILTAFAVLLVVALLAYRYYFFGHLVDQIRSSVDRILSH